MIIWRRWTGSFRPVDNRAEGGLVRGSGLVAFRPAAFISHHLLWGALPPSGLKEECMPELLLIHIMEKLNCFNLTADYCNRVKTPTNNRKHLSGFQFREIWLS